MPITFTNDSVSVASAAPSVVPPVSRSVNDQGRQQAATLLRALADYVHAHAVAHPSLVPAIIALRDAVAEYRTGTATDPLSGVRAVVAIISQVRAVETALPQP